MEQYADRNKWAEIWETLDWDASTALNKNHLIKSCERFFDISSVAEAKAVIKVGVMSDSIQKGPDGFLLCSERPETYWLEIWDDYDNEYEDNLSKQHILLSISTAEGVNRKEAEDILKGAIDRGEIYAPEDADDDQYAINDPATDTYGHRYVNTFGGSIFLSAVRAASRSSSRSSNRRFPRT